MIKSIGLIVSVCLTALVISSCGGGGTESGYEANLSRIIRSDAYDPNTATGPSVSPGIRGGGNIRVDETTSTTSSTTSSSSYEGYVNKYGDLLAVFNASGGGQTKSAWGKNHYCNNGRAEGRTYSGLSAASCSSVSAESQYGADARFE